jgi:hypothetical protein
MEEDKEKTNINFEKIMETMNTLALQEETMTIAKRLLMEGKMEGKMETEESIIINMLTNGLQPKQIAQYTGVDLKTVLKIQKKGNL